MRFTRNANTHPRRSGMTANHASPKSGEQLVGILQRQRGDEEKPHANGDRSNGAHIEIAIFFPMLVLHTLPPLPLPMRPSRPCGARARNTYLHAVREAPKAFAPLRSCALRGLSALW